MYVCIYVRIYVYMQHFNFEEIVCKKMSLTDAAIVISTGLGYLLPGPDFQGLLREDEHRLDRVHAAVRAAEPDPWCPI